MGTISRKFVCDGYCPLDQDTVSIEIEYISLKRPGEDKRHKRFTKMSNQCWYLAAGKCDKYNDCPVFQNAECVRYEDYSGICY